MTKAKEETKEEKSEKPSAVPLGQPETQPEVTKEQLQTQLNYAQKIINSLQLKVNEAAAKMVQLEAQLEMANEDRANMLKQLEPLGIAPIEE